MKIGVISDTHNYLDPKVTALFAGVDHILHAGDVGQPWLVLQLEELAPVTVVLGNTDDHLHYREIEIVTLAERKFLVHHIVDPRAPRATPLRDRLERETPAVVVFGHTHKPFCEQIGPTLFFNPGYAGKQRFALPRTVALLHCDANGIRTEFLDL